MANELLDAALDYAKRGWPIFPVGPTKQPYPGTNGVLEATTDAAKIRAWWDKWPRANVALDVGGAGMMALDLDPGHDVAALERALGSPLPPTMLRARTPRGGLHLFFAINPGEIVAPSASKLSPHVDVRSFNSYVLLAPSTTADGAYVWESAGKPAHRLDEMVRLSNSTRGKSATRDEWIIKPDLPENIARAETWLARDAKLAIEGQGGDHAAYATAAMMRSFGLSEETAFDCMWRVWNPRCLPPWTAEEVDHLAAKVKNGYSYATSDPGNVTPAYRVAKAAAIFKPVAVELPSGREFNAGRFRFVDRAGMANIKPPSWLVEDFIPADAYAIIIGAPRSFKTFIALDIGLSLATGFAHDPIWQVADAGRVLYIAGEGRSEFSKRVEAWERKHWHGERAENFMLADPVPNISEDWTPFIDGSLALAPDGYKLVILDTVGRAMQGVNENAQEYASAFTAKVEVLQRALGCSVLALHHTGHDGATRARGSSVFGADADTIVQLDRNEQDYAVSLIMRKQKDAPEWSQPRGIKLEEIVLREGIKSLVAVKPAPGQRIAPVKAAPKGSALDLIVGGIIDKALAALLSSNPLKKWTTKEVAEALAMSEGVEISSGHLRNAAGPLIRLRETRGTYASRAYDPLAKHWRHQSIQ